jgi:hypothetical protein
LELAPRYYFCIIIILGWVSIRSVLVAGLEYKENLNEIVDFQIRGD